MGQTRRPYVRPLALYGRTSRCSQARFLRGPPSIITSDYGVWTAPGRRSTRFCWHPRHPICEDHQRRRYSGLRWGEEAQRQKAASIGRYAEYGAQSQGALVEPARSCSDASGAGVSPIVRSGMPQRGETATRPSSRRIRRAARTTMDVKVGRQTRLPPAAPQAYMPTSQSSRSGQPQRPAPHNVRTQDAPRRAIHK